MMLMGAGFPRHHVEFCLLKTGDAEAAINMLMDQNFLSDLPSEQELIEKLHNQKIAEEAANDPDAPPPKVSWLCMFDPPAPYDAELSERLEAAYENKDEVKFEARGYPYHIDWSIM